MTEPEITLTVGPGTGRMLCQVVLTRADFATLCNLHGLLGTAVEVGVHRGEFAAGFLELWRGLRYIGVDPWRVLPAYSERLDHSESTSQDAREADYAAARRAIAPYAGRAELLRATSEEAAGALPDALHFVYIDAAHDLASVRHDIALWWPKVRPGGILAGHDYANPWAPAVTVAVDEFAQAAGLTVWLAGIQEQPPRSLAATQEDLPSWYLWRP